MTTRHSRARWAAASAVLVLAGCVGPAALSLSPPRASGPSADIVDAALEPTAATAVTEGTPPAAVEPSATAPLREWRTGEGVAGVDVSRYQRSVDWPGLVASGHAFAFVKATEGTNHRSPTHDEQRDGAREAGILQGAYHYAHPGQSSGTLQARFFHANGGAWAPDGLTLPGALDLEAAEEGDTCHGLTPAEMTAWVRAFSDEYRRLSGRVPVIYTKAELWDECTGADTSFGDHPLWLYDHGNAPGDLPAGWDRPTLWQRAVENHLDRNVFFGTGEQLISWVSAPVR